MQVLGVTEWMPLGKKCSYTHDWQAQQDRASHCFWSGVSHPADRRWSIEAKRKRQARQQLARLALQLPQQRRRSNRRYYSRWYGHGGSQDIDFVGGGQRLHHLDIRCENCLLQARRTRTPGRITVLTPPSILREVRCLKLQHDMWVVEGAVYRLTDHRESERLGRFVLASREGKAVAWEITRRPSVESLSSTRAWRWDHTSHRSSWICSSVCRRLDGGSWEEIGFWRHGGALEDGWFEVGIGAADRRGIGSWGAPGLHAVNGWHAIHRDGKGLAADGMTKALQGQALQKFRRFLFMQDCEARRILRRSWQHRRCTLWRTGVSPWGILGGLIGAGGALLALGRCPDYWRPSYVLETREKTSIKSHRAGTASESTRSGREWPTS